MQAELATELLVFDIETRRIADLRKLLGTDEKIERLAGMDVADLRRVADRNDIAVAANWKDPEKILNKVKTGFEDMVNKAALKQWGAQICSIACKPLRGVHESLKFLRTGKAISDEPGYEPPMVWTVNDTYDERQIIHAFMSHLQTYAVPPILGGFNIRGTTPGRKGFDIPMLRIRCALLGIEWPTWLPSTMYEDRISKMLFDFCDIVKEGTCDQWLKVSGLPPKSASGSSVQDMTPEELFVYNANDVELERLLTGLVIGTQPSYLQNLAYDNV